MIQIDDLPDPTPLACSTCMSPLTWIWVHHLRRNVAVIPVSGVDRWTFRIHTCRLTADRTWRNVQVVDPRTARHGARRARAAIAAKTKSNPFPEEST